MAEVAILTSRAILLDKPEMLQLLHRPFLGESYLKPSDSCLAIGALDLLTVQNFW